MLNDFDSNLRDLKNFQQKFVLSPEQWRSFVPTPPLAWRKVKFAETTVGQVPKVRGIYAFVVQFQDHDARSIALPPHGYVLYVGITGHRSEERTLRDRYRDYLREKKRAKRVQIYSMLNKWPDDLFFHFARVSKPRDLGQLEIDLNDAIIPPYVTNDFSAKVKQLVRVLRAN